MALAGRGMKRPATPLAKAQLENGRAFEKLKEMVSAQGGDAEVLRIIPGCPGLLFKKEALSPKEGYLTHMDTRLIGGICRTVKGRAGRKKGIPSIKAGITLTKGPEIFAKQGESIAALWASRQALFAPAMETFYQSLSFGAAPLNREPLIYAKVTKDGVHWANETANRAASRM